MALKSSLLAAVRHMLIPIARILIRNGVTYSDFDEVVRHAYAKAGESVLRERNFKASLARLSVVCGLSRRELERVMGTLPQVNAPSLSDTHPAARALHAWHTKPPFVLLPVGVPMELDYDASDTKATFVELVRTHVPDADPSALLTTLITCGAVRQDERGRLHAVSRTFVAAELNEEQVKHIGRAARRFLDTVDVNLTAESRKIGRFERVVTADNGVPVKRYDEFVAYIRSTMQKTLEDIDEWITANSMVDSDEPVMWTGVGMYHWLENPEDFDYELRDALDEAKPLQVAPSS